MSKKLWEILWISYGMVRLLIEACCGVVGWATRRKHGI